MNNDYLDARTPEERAADAKIKGVTTTSTPIPMNNESKCCEECISASPYFSGGLGGRPRCINPSCPCHTPAPEDWEKAFRKCFSDVLHSSGTNLAFEDLMIPFVRRLLASEKAAARREGAERACDYIANEWDKFISGRSFPSDKEMRQILDAARSEGVNG